jgi:acyl transferase domain-containing protein
VSDSSRTSLKPVTLQILELIRSGQLSAQAGAPLLRSLSDLKPACNIQSAQPIAVVGLGGAFPGARNIPGFWRFLRQGADAIQEVPPERWDWRTEYDEQPRPGKTYSRWGGFLEGIDEFDPLFFNISPREALAMDPQQRLFLEAAWHALEDGGHADRAI